MATEHPIQKSIQLFREWRKEHEHRLKSIAIGADPKALIANIAEDLGFLGAIFILVLFFALAWYGYRAAGRAPDRFGSLVAVGITTWITSQAIINMGAVIGVLPVTGIPLPFISFGGSSLVITLAAMGILLNIAMQERSGPRAASQRRRRLVRA